MCLCVCVCACVYVCVCMCVCVCLCVTYSWQTKEARCSQVPVSDAGPRLHHRHHGGELTDCSLNHLRPNRYRGACGSTGNLAISTGFQHPNPGRNLLDKNRNPVPSLRERSEARLWLALSGIVISLALKILRTLVLHAATYTTAGSGRDEQCQLVTFGVLMPWPSAVHGHLRMKERQQ